MEDQIVVDLSRYAKLSAPQPVTPAETAQAGPGPSTRSTRARTTSGNGSRNGNVSVNSEGIKEKTALPEYLQPDHFSPLNNSANPSVAARAIPTALNGLLSPEDDPNALRGIPVFRPTMEEFEDFEGYVTKTVSWGQYSGITKIIPPAEWTSTVPPITKSSLANVRIHHPIQQNPIGNAGLFRVAMMVKNKNRDLTVQEWFNKCKEKKFVGPGPKDMQRTTNRDSKEAKERLAAIRAEMRREKEEKRAKRLAAAERKASRNAAAAEGSHEDGGDEETRLNDDPNDPQATDPSQNVPPLDSSLISPHSSPDPIATTPDADPVDPWYRQFDPSVDWLPSSTKQEDYTMEACAALERHFWKNMGMGEPSWYGADMEGSLFEDEKTPWNVAHLPNLLNRWDLQSLPGVNSPYLYFGMWGAAFAWHVEDMDLFSINYIHFGAPKFWYAVPQLQAEKLERVLQGYFPEDARRCDQFLRHKAFAVSPYRLSDDGVHVNMVVHNQNEFIITYPRGYHAGFNMGFNCAESVNFALDSWLELGRRAKACQCVDHSVQFDVDELMAKEEKRLKGEQELVEAISEERRTKRPRKRPADGTSDARKRPRHSHALDEDITIANSVDDVDEITPPQPKIPAMRKKKPTMVINLSPDCTPSKPAIVLENPVYPCLFCPSTSTDELLSVFEPTEAVKDIWKPRTEEIKAHHSCALAMPGVGIEDREVEGRVQTFVLGSESIEKSRWNLKCAECQDKRLQKSGAKIQCTKGKCPKAYHVSCAKASNTASLKIWEVETPVLPADGEPVDVPVVMNVDIKVELLCAQHNPDMKERNEQRKADAYKEKVMAIPVGSSIKVKSRGGASLEYVLRETHAEPRNVVIVTDGVGAELTFPWTSIDFRPTQTKVVENEYARHHTHTRRATDDQSDDRLPLDPNVRTARSQPTPAAQVNPAMSPTSSNRHIRPLRVNDMLNPQKPVIPSRVVLCDSAYIPGHSSRTYPSVLQAPCPSPLYAGDATPRHGFLLPNQRHQPMTPVYPPYHTRDLGMLLPDRRGSASTYPTPVPVYPGHRPHTAPYHNANDFSPVPSYSHGPKAYAASTSHIPAAFNPGPQHLPQMPGGLTPPSLPGSGESSGVGKIDLGLTRMKHILGKLRPMTVPAIHLAGTNGKGSVSAILESCLMAAGLKIARYNSPHLVEPRDAVRINGVPPSKQDYLKAVDLIEHVNRIGSLQATTFEIATAAAYFLINDVQPPVDVMIIECGLGGAKDATNVIPDEITLASALTSVGLDHTAFLGNTIAEIAAEKSEIAVRGGLLIVGPQMHRDAVTVASAVAARIGAKVIEALRSEVISSSGTFMSLDPFRAPGPTFVRTPLPLAFDSPSVVNGVQPTIDTEFNLGGKHQLDNLSLALTILHTIRLDSRARQIQPKLATLSDMAIKYGVAQTQWAGRCSWLEWKSDAGRTYPLLVDGAHNADSAATLRQYIDELKIQPRPPVTFIISLSSSPGKTIESVLGPLLRAGDTVQIVDFTTPVEGMPWIRPIDKAQAAEVASRFVGGAERVMIGGAGVRGVRAAIENATSRWMGEPRLLVLCGSLYLVADVYRLQNGQV